MTKSLALISLGCAKNLSDSEDLVTGFKSVGFQLTDQLPEADAVLVNTCGFIEDAKRESIDHILEATDERKSDAKLFVAGCLTNRYLAELSKGMPEVDQWLTFKQYQQLPAILHQHFPDLDEHHLSHDQRSQLTPPHFAFLKIAEGCDNSCNFCAIPLIRGKHVSRPFEELAAQAQIYHKRGVKEINLISQQLDYYGQDRYGQRRLPELVQAVAAAAPESWVRLHYCYPNDFDQALIDAMAKTPGVVPYVDMPLQHASDRMLAVMGRRTDRAHIEGRLDAIRQAMPEVALRSTFIVGFPGERDEDFQQLLDFTRAQAFDQVGCFAYSDEEGTTAAKMPHKIPDEVIQERHQAFMSQQQALHQQRQQRWLQRELTVLVDEQLDFDRYACRHAGQASEVDSCTLVQSNLLHVGEWARVRITGQQGYDLLATVC
jgi:ribosomal protein S12 methylthiotransferase